MASQVSGALDGMDLAQTQELLFELQDELRVMEDKVGEREAQLEQIIDKNKKREKALLDGLEAVVGYTTILEQSVVQPAIGDLLLELRKHYSTAAAARGEATGKIGKILSSGSSRLAKLLSMLHNPSNNAMAVEEKRRQALDYGTFGVHQPEDAYVLVSTLLQDKQQLKQVLRYCTQSLSQLNPGDPPGASSHDGTLPGERSTKAVERLTREIGMLQQQNDSLKAEVQRLHVLCQQTSAQVHDGESGRVHAELSLLKQEKSILGQQLESLASTSRQERLVVDSKVDSLQSSLNQMMAERDVLRSRADVAEKDAAHATRERHQLQQKNLALDGALQQLHQDRSLVMRKLEQAETKNLLLEQERAIVKQKFETVELALSQGENEKRTLRDEVALMRGALSGRVDLSDYELLRREREEANRLRHELDTAHRDRNTNRDADDDLVQIRTENVRLRNDIEREKEGSRQIIDNYKRREEELVGRCDTLRDVGDRLRMELEQALLSQRESAAMPHGSGLLGGDGMQNRITAFEMSMNKLTNEIGGLESHINDLDSVPHKSFAGSPNVNQQLQEKLDFERRKFEAERNECDQIVHQMTQELELLVQENQRLKQQQYQQQQQQQHSKAY